MKKKKKKGFTKVERFLYKSSLVIIVFLVVGIVFTSTAVSKMNIELQDMNKKSSTISRNLASIRSFYQYLIRTKKIKNDPTENIQSPKVEKKSTVGAGDSMVGGMVWALSQNKTLKEVIQMGVCCGSAATMNEGTQLFKAEDVINLLDEIE